MRIQMSFDRREYVEIEMASYADRYPGNTGYELRMRGRGIEHNELVISLEDSHLRALDAALQEFKQRQSKKAVAKK